MKFFQRRERDGFNIKKNPRTNDTRSDKRIIKKGKKKKKKQSHNRVLDDLYSTSVTFEWSKKHVKISDYGIYGMPQLLNLMGKDHWINQNRLMLFHLTRLNSSLRNTFSHANESVFLSCWFLILRTTIETLINEVYSKKDYENQRMNEYSKEFPQKSFFLLLPDEQKERSKIHWKKMSPYA